MVQPRLYYFKHRIEDKKGYLEPLGSVFYIRNDYPQYSFGNFSNNMGDA